MKPPITVLEELQSDLNDGVSKWTNRMESLLNFAEHDLEAVILDWYEERKVYESRIAMLEAELKLDGYEQPAHNHELQLALEIAS